MFFRLPQLRMRFKLVIQRYIKITYTRRKQCLNLDKFADATTIVFGRSVLYNHSIFK